MGSTGDFQVLFKQILLRNGVPTKYSTSEKRNGNVCPEHSKYAVPSLTLQNHGCKSCAELNKPSLEQISRDKPSMEQSSHDNPSLVETSHYKLCLEQTLHKNPFFLPDSSGKRPLEQLKQFSDRTRVGNLHGFNHSQNTAHRRKQQAVGQRSNRKKGNVCPEHSKYAVPSLTLQNHGCKSCAELNKPSLEQISRDKPSMEQTSHDNPSLVETSHYKPYLEQTLHKNPFFLPDSSGKPPLEQRKQFSDKTRVGNLHGFNHSRNTAHRRKQQAVGQGSNRKKEKVCPEHSSYALPSLTLQNHGCKSCAMLNSEEKGHNFRNPGKSYFEQTKQSSRPFKEKTDDFPGATEHNQYDFNRSQNTVPRGKRYSQRPKTVQAETRKICEILALSRNFYKQASLESHARDFDGAGVNLYHENSPVYEKYEDDYDSSSGLQHGMKKSLGNPWGDSKWKSRSAKYDNRR